MTKIAVVEDHEIFKRGMVTLLCNLPNVEVVNESSSGDEFLDTLQESEPDIVFMDIKLPGIDGIETTRKALQILPSLKVIALTMHEDNKHLKEMLKAGAKGFLFKNISRFDVEKAMHSVMNGNQFFSEELMNIMADKFLSPKKEEDKAPCKFSNKEMEILKLISKGFTNLEIGEKLSLSNRTVDGLRARMIERVKASNSVGLVVYAIKHNLIQV
ncbi:MAG: DNA-binding response regulator [Bacteroidetes bacterium HGW-Bacteroidetes-21]|jgi:DNA-binding NarL/FixJ family response regulator|nr:MAG: DNA-binding response regulator [Bacteroidetes bacterium HGW-Bacteroidetes-21]